jgi:hypothetical protein
VNSPHTTGIYFKIEPNHDENLPHQNAANIMMERQDHNCTTTATFRILGRIGAIINKNARHLQYSEKPESFDKKTG